MTGLFRPPTVTVRCACGARELPPRFYVFVVARWIACTTAGDADAQLVEVAAILSQPHRPTMQPDPVAVRGSEGWL